MNAAPIDNERGFPSGAGILLGLGIGGFFDGIVLHQLLQWHHLLSNVYPPDTLANLKNNTFWDGVFHTATYIFVALGLALLWHRARQPHVKWSSKMFVGTLLMGFGIFNLVEGIVNHQILSIHHVNETVPRSQWIYWDLGFLAWGAIMLVGGWFAWQSGHATLDSVDK
jgi:uncharacterized membrane protein